MVEFTDTFIPNALILMQVCFKKILTINLTKNEYSLVYIAENELEDYEHVKSLKITDWFRFFIENNTIHPDDIKAFVDFTNIDNLRCIYKKDSSSKLSIKYRRFRKNEYIWSIMVFLPSVDYSDNNQNIIAFVRDVDEESREELEYKVKLEELSFTDNLTKLQNRHRYSMTIKEKKLNSDNVGIIFIDLNGLKYVNDTKGHYAGDKLIKILAKIILNIYGKNNCYRIGGDEFVVITSETQEEFKKQEKQLIAEMCNHEFTIASIGSAYGKGKDIDSVIQKAESRMYKDKKEFYKHNPKFDVRDLMKELGHNIQ